VTARAIAFKDDLYRRLAYRHCHYCYVRITRAQATTDHKVPKAHGGPTHRSNFVLACEPCNRRKGTTPYDTFKQLMMPVKRRRKERRRGRR
jgi:5-methylcytosine-specific restriction endonuclease McrA